MIRIYATGQDDFIEDDRVAVYVSHGKGNRTGGEVHLTLIDPEDGAEVRGWFPKAALLAAITQTTGDSA